jgi:hypothetical protein
MAYQDKNRLSAHRSWLLADGGGKLLGGGGLGGPERGPAQPARSRGAAFARPQGPDAKPPDVNARLWRDGPVLLGHHGEDAVLNRVRRNRAVRNLVEVGEEVADLGRRCAGVPRVSQPVGWKRAGAPRQSMPRVFWRRTASASESVQTRRLKLHGVVGEHDMMRLRA